MWTLDLNENLSSIREERVGLVKINKYRYSHSGIQWHFVNLDEQFVCVSDSTGLTYWLGSGPWLESSLPGCSNNLPWDILSSLNSLEVLLLPIIRHICDSLEEVFKPEFLQVKQNYSQKLQCKYLLGQSVGELGCGSMESCVIQCDLFQRRSG